ncbi:MAG: zinc ABC transporter ATP-binding protein ZnuC [gamma proteobacterium endosymbiont of Lamellibrachia anaximandri]|nr:zinc ABC transporter ATP-binding protein ZnuC [gamma proteobacterium endosymbiont of Lamellibrachia anaximandri]
MAERDLLLEADGVSMAFGGREVLRHVSLVLHRGEILTLIGPNGSGKSTLVRLLLGLLTPTAGALRRADGLRIGYMPQKLQVDEVLPLSVARFLTLTGRYAKEKVAAVLREVGAYHVSDHPLQSVSGGELQRVLLARALLREPDLLVLDEPVQGVDVNGQVALYNLIGRIRDQRGCGILMVSHDLHLVMAATDRVLCLNHHVCCSGTPEVVTRHPAYLDLFGDAAFAVYSHHHDHAHDLHGNVIPGDESHCESGDSDG